ncbi:serine hydrolase-domain-containing protein [Aspergillus unguis]
MKPLVRSWRAILESLNSYLDRSVKESQDDQQKPELKQEEKQEQGQEPQEEQEQKQEEKQEPEQKTTMLAPTLPPKAKILMLHGNGQSGDFFRCKTRFLHAPILQAFEAAANTGCEPSFSGIQFDYPDGPIPTPPPDTTLYPEEPTTFNWGYGDLSSGGGAILGAEKALDAILHELSTNGPYVGIIGFSAGAALAVVTASVLENKHRPPIPIPKSKLTHPPLSFVVAFGGFVLGGEKYQHAYEMKVQTPVLQFIGDVDPIVPEDENMKLMGHCEWGLMVRFFGAHYVPRGREVAGTIVEFIEDAMGWVDRWGWTDV